MTTRLTMYRAAAFVLGLLAAGAVAAQDAAAALSENDIPSGLEAFLEARLLESQDRYREALDAYGRAYEENPSVVEVRVGYAGLLLRVGKADRAVEILDGVDGLDWHGRRIFALALAQESTTVPDRTEQAIEALTEVREERDDDPNLSLALGQLLHRVGRIEDAEAVIGELSRSRPDSPQLVAYHATLLLQLDRRDEAAELYARCATNPVTVDRCRDAAVDLFIDLGRPGDAADVILATFDDDELDQQMRAAYLLWEARRPAEALSVVEGVLRQAPDSDRGRVLKAHLLSAVGRFGEAVEDFRRLVKKHPGDAEMKLSLAWALARTDAVDEARRWLDRAWELVAADASSALAVRCAVTGSRIELVVGNPLAAREWLARVADPAMVGEEYVQLLGETYRRTEDWADGISAMVRLQPQLDATVRVAAEAIEAEFRMRSSDPRAWSRLRPLLDSDDSESVVAGLRVLQVSERWSDTQREAAKARLRFPDNEDILFVLATSLERLDRFEEAESVFLKLVEANPDDANTANYLGYLWAERGVRLEEALELINRAVTMEPENAAFLDSLGWVHYRLGSLEEAEYWLRRAVEISGNDGTLLAHLGEVLVARGEVDEGIRYLRLGLDLGCEDPEHVQSVLDEARNDSED